ncbi:uncharacterized protein EI97DRAFT_458291 [Westerdykella ornata]|uniref:Histone chaperone domain-containing protein n=1 Tax=Westerdykella ornata TaxID=318751 RepID=A0A6A6JI73_WESOR|nr:uncharacterized protein EI97DRAFT_458291 [Westerdykella ornata]KAF2276350.1 hypothetical protein EI97DRAFT_458291 [Westerdykella ornata]
MDTAISRKRLQDVKICDHRRTRPKLGTPASNESAVPARSASRAASTSGASDIRDMDSEGSSELSESSEEPSSESSSDAASESTSDDDDDDSGSETADERNESGPVNLRANRGEKPHMRISKDELGPDIRDFLKDFLPQLKAANEELEAERQAGTLENRKIETEGDGEGEYIEMNLGLGVLEEKDPDAAADSSESDSEEDSQTEKDIMGKLLGRKEKPIGAHIEEVEDEEHG